MNILILHLVPKKSRKRATLPALTLQSSTVLGLLCGIAAAHNIEPSSGSLPPVVHAVMTGTATGSLPVNVDPAAPGTTNGAAGLNDVGDGLHARALEPAVGAAEHGVEVAAFQQELAQAHRGIVGVGEEGVLDDNAAASRRL